MPQPASPSPIPPEQQLPTAVPLMPLINFWFDPISPFAWLAFQHLPHILAGRNFQVRYHPVFLGGLLRHFGSVGPAEIESKRHWTYRHCLWLARQNGIPFAMPSVHPFPNLPLLRLCLEAADSEGCTNRFVSHLVQSHVWEGAGRDPSDPERLQTLRQLLMPQIQKRGYESARENEEASKLLLRKKTEQAIEQGIFGVPMMEVHGNLFWGFDGLPMLRDYLDGLSNSENLEHPAQHIALDIANIHYGIPRRSLGAAQ